MTHVNGMGKAEPNLFQMKGSILFPSYVKKENKADIQLYVVLMSLWWEVKESEKPRKQPRIALRCMGKTQRDELGPYNNETIGILMWAPT